MSCTVNVLCYKSKLLANGEHPLMICISKDGKRKYQSTGISISPQHWDFKKDKPKRSCPNKNQIQELINEKIKQYSEHVLELTTLGKEFTPTQLLEKTKGLSSNCTVVEFFEIYIRQLRKAGRLKYAATFSELKSSLIDFNKHLNIYFSDIDNSWLSKYENHLRRKELAENTIGIRFRTLRAIYNKAISEGITKYEYYPFKTFNVSRLHKETAKRAISKVEIEKVINYQSNDRYSLIAIDLFYFSYLCAGINLTDIAYLKAENLFGCRLVYTRRKTKKLIKIPLQEAALNIIQKYHQPQNIYIFPILSKAHKTDVQQMYRIKKVLRKINIRLTAIGQDLSLPIKLTTYVARHRNYSYQLDMSELQN